MSNARIYGLWMCAIFTSVAHAATDVPSQAVAILEKRCLSCHGDKTAMGGLRLHTRDTALRGGNNGPVILPGKADTSRMFLAVTHQTKVPMPPAGKLSDAEIAVVRDWINQGAAWPSEAKLQQAETWWAFQKAARPAVPEGDAHPVDAFVRDRLRKESLTPAAPATKLALLRRASFDLHGLPPSKDQIDSFLKDTSPKAWEKVLDDLLASPRYGEKWGRHWLDLVRYGDTSGFEQDPYTLEAWRFRDYVIQSFNDDKPYDRLIKEHLAGDEIYPGDPQSRTGTGFYRIGPNRDMLFKVEDLNRVEKLTDYVETTSGVFLGLTVGCARCHDHKFDPIPQRDFYRLQAVFAAVTDDKVLLDYNPARFFDLAENTRKYKLRQIGDTLDRLFKPHRDAIRKRKLSSHPPAVLAAFETAEEKRTSDQQALVSTYADQARVSDAEVRAAMSQADQERLHEVEKRLVSMFTGYGPPAQAHGVVDISREAPKTFLAPRGNWQTPGEEVEPGFLTCLGGGEVPEPPLHATTSYRRKALAEWIASPENPLTARVMVNRIWQFHFGQGLLRTPSDWGTRAGKPSHPELLDWMAAEFVARKWSIKSMHRLIMTSETYRQSANPSAQARERDPNNLLLSHYNRRRLSSEEVRDAILQASGTLNLKMGGIPVVPPLEEEELYGIIGRPSDAWYVTTNAEEHTRRSIYMLSRRTFRQPMFEAFDTPDGVVSCPKREASTTATQSLTLLNSRFMLDQSKALAAKAGGVAEVWRRVYGRDPNSAEAATAKAFLDRQSTRLGSAQAAMAELARAMLNSNEFLYVD